MKNHRFQRQRGVSLLIVLLLLLVMTLLGLASLRGTIMGEKSTANTYDRSLSFQAAESALRIAEARILTNPVFPTGATCNAGLCPEPNGSDADAWISNPSGNWTTTTVNLGAITAAPQYIIEPFGSGRRKERTSDCLSLGVPEDECLAPAFRITARSSANERAQVILQSNYVRP